MRALSEKRGSVGEPTFSAKAGKILPDYTSCTTNDGGI